MAEVPVIQVLHKEQYFTQKLISLPDEIPSPALAPSSLRLRTKAFTLSSNNFVYCKLGFALGWWGFHPLPASTPEPYNDASTYGRTNAWGYMEVLDSTVESVPKGSFLYGYLPIGTLAQDVQFEPSSVPGYIIATSDYRKNLMSIYNHYAVFGPEVGAQIQSKSLGAGVDIVFHPMIETAILLSQFVFSEDPKKTIGPMGNLSTGWTSEKADITDATLIFLAPGSKVGIALAHFFKQGRQSNKPKRIVGAASDYSAEFVKGTNKYDDVVSTKDSPTEFLSKLGVGADEKVILFDLGGRGSIGQQWAGAIPQTHKNFLLLAIGAEISEVSQANITAAFSAPKPEFFVQVNASDMRTQAFEKFGEAEYLATAKEAVESFKTAKIDGFKIAWGEGMESVEKGWNDLAKGNVSSDTGLAFVV